LARRGRGSAILPASGALLVEKMFLRLEAYIHGDWNHPKGNDFVVPDGLGLSADPDPNIIKDYTDPNG
jgi:hypothetical protein